MARPRTVKGVDSSRLRVERIQKDLSQHELGAASNLPASTIAGIELGTRHPWPAWRKRIAKALKVPERKLFRELDEVRVSA